MERFKMKQIIIIMLCLLLGILFSLKFPSKSCTKTGEKKQQTYLRENIGLTSEARDKLNKILNP